MAGFTKILKQAQEMKKNMESMQQELETQELNVSSGGGAVEITINGKGRFNSISIDEGLLKEDKALVEETLLSAIQDATDQSEKLREERMSQITAGLSIPGMF